ncbi:unnamed protein product [Plasmodium vivax]|uniref:(malaria parasite P. vivax) hypothetical protein n=1 Tax=Plasmodium vivax TaxID=5855 RepID=A0A8S4HIQ0_PLAVI|nr:unnamed protein product [Plasmodium vivax]
MSNDKDYCLDKIKEAYNFISDSVFYKIYKEFDISCNSKDFDGGASCPPDPFGDSTISEKVINLLKDLYSNLYRVYYTSENKTNDYFDDSITEVKEIGCMCLKYWLYDQIVSKGLEESQIKELFSGHAKYINGKIKDVPNNYCNFNELSLNHINTLKNIYAFYTIIYDNANNIETCDSEKCKYMNYFGKGLDDFINSIEKCSVDTSNINYCNQFNEFIELCKKDNVHAGISIYHEPTKSKAGTKGKYFLSYEKYQNEPLYIYLKDEKMLNFLKTSHFISNKNSTTIAATSVVGSAIGLSSIFYYLYKFTLFGSSLRRGKEKNLVNNDEEAHNSSLYKSNTEKLPLQNREYKVQYHTFNDA